ncbi:hypothetical protein PHYSODRAFT_248704 [Phytophthora sojae]|uniref:Uncharacterized protein n=1 Tax=Phytophthora sojae (strain P6497) TaxID=1094619 RepID=G4ZY72_PHYSP|nr:hypothetical protein PHYSODRAFT_248704 [Phytophthora sojae]EGZ12684.1 hypothetical protein PHYSODRAFT_248704 [Phytophthora sojae]|eukprot:XP_009533017.1 hypothetical protein PHYSODRAFT_248704 [Phytophthora sojae]
MDAHHAQVLQSLREQIRYEALSDVSSSRRGLMLPSAFLEVLRANSVPLGRSEARVLLWQFQEPNGAVSATTFLRWIALSAPVDHVNPDLLFPQLPQPYRRIMKVWERDIFDAAWEIITTESVRFRAETAASEGGMNSSRSATGADKPQQQRNDYEVAKRRTCEPSWQIPLDSSAQQVAGLASHCLLSLMVAGINYDDASTSTAPSLPVLSTAENDVKVLGDFPVEFPRVDAEVPVGAADTATKVHVSIKALSSLQLANDNSGLPSCGIAVHLVETTTSQQQEPVEDAKPAAPTFRECVNIYTSQPVHRTMNLLELPKPSAQDMTTQYLTVGCQDGTVVVWDVLQDSDYAFLAPFSDADDTAERPPPRQKLSAAVSTEVSHVVFYQAEYVIALSKSQQRIYFFDVRERGKPALKRVISPPAKKSSTKTRQTSAQPANLMLNITAVADLPVALVEYSNGMVMLYDVRTAEAIGSFWATLPSATSPAAHVASSTSLKSNESLGVLVTITGNQDVLGAAANPTPSTEATETNIKLYSWRDLLLVCFPSLTTLLEQYQEEATITNIKQLLLTSDLDDVSAAAPPSTVTALGTSVDPLETMLLRMAGETPPSSTRTRQSNAGSLSPLQSPFGRSSVSITASNAVLLSQSTESTNSADSSSVVMLEPLVQDDKAFFDEYCREHLDPLAIADQEARLHRKRRELLKTMSAGGAW